MATWSDFQKIADDALEGVGCTPHMQAVMFGIHIGKGFSEQLVIDYVFWLRKVSSEVIFTMGEVRALLSPSAGTVLYAQSANKYASYCEVERALTGCIEFARGMHYDMSKFEE